MIEVSDTPYEIATAYIKVLEKHWHKTKATYIKNGTATCELHKGIVISAETPEQLETVLRSLK